jgi:cytoskeletal protein CcmA (bactofilin family)
LRCLKKRPEKYTVEFVEKGERNMSPVESMTETNRLFIGEGVTMKGQVTVPDTLVVCGMLEGEVSASNLVVGEAGIIKGKISVSQNADISGKVVEQLDVRNLLILRSTSHVDGNVSYGMLQIEQGATLAGGISSTNSQQDQKSAKPRQPASNIRTVKQVDLSVIELIPNTAGSPDQAAEVAQTATRSVRAPNPAPARESASASGSPATQSRP